MYELKTNKLGVFLFGPVGGGEADDMRCCQNDILVLRISNSVTG